MLNARGAPDAGSCTEVIRSTSGNDMLAHATRVRPGRAVRGAQSWRDQGMTCPLVSVYLPTRNRVRLLARALDSVFRQTYAPIEVIVVDDGSTDGTPELLAELRRSHTNLVCLRHDVAQGAPAARNRAIHAAHGEFITGLDDDDQFMPERIERFIEDWQARRTRGDSFSALYAQDVARAASGQSITRKPPQVTWRDLCRMNGINNQVFTTRSMLRDAGMFDPELPMWQDLECWIRLTGAFGPAMLTDSATYIFNTDSATDRLSFQGKARLRQAYEHLIRKHAAGLELALKRSLFLQMYADHYTTHVGMDDLGSFVKQFGFHPPGILRLIWVALRHRALPIVRKLKARTFKRAAR